MSIFAGGDVSELEQAGQLRCAMRMAAKYGGYNEEIPLHDTILQ